MDDDKEEKSIIEKISEKVKGIVDTASVAATKAMEPQPDPEQVAGTTSEQVYIPEATDPTALPASLISSPKSRKKGAPPSMSGRITPTYDFPLPDSPMPTSKKTKTKVAVKKAAKKRAKRPPKKSKSSAGRKAIGKKKRPRRS